MSPDVVAVIQGQAVIFVDIVSQVKSPCFLIEEFDNACTATVHVDSKARSVARDTDDLTVSVLLFFVSSCDLEFSVSFRTSLNVQASFTRSTSPKGAKLAQLSPCSSGSEVNSLSLGQIILFLS